ncbi:MAG: hypothetical protein ABI867_05505 [Kofleriaceae bacterium]
MATRERSRQLGDGTSAALLSGMKNTTLATIQTETLAQVTGGEGAGWMGMIQSALGSKNPGSISQMVGGGSGGGLNGKGGGLAESVGGWARGLFGGSGGGTVEGK